MNEQSQYLGDGVTAQLVDDQIKLTAGANTIYLERETLAALERFANTQLRPQDQPANVIQMVEAASNQGFFVSRDQVDTRMASYYDGATVRQFA